jgi:hypothetical protein
MEYELEYDNVDEAIQAELERRAMEALQHQKWKLHPEAEFDLPLEMLKRIRLFKEQDWRTYKACCESEYECFNDEHEFECDCCIEQPSFLTKKTFWGTKRLYYELYLAMRTSRKKILNVTRINMSGALSTT